MNEPTKFEMEVLQACADLGTNQIGPKEFEAQIEAALVREKLRQNTPDPLGLGWLGGGLKTIKRAVKRKCHLEVIPGGKDV